MQSEYEGQVDIFGVAGRSAIDDMATFVDRTGVGDFPHIADLEGEVWAEFEVRSQPAFAFVNDDGTFTVHVGALGESGLVERIDALLAT